MTYLVFKKVEESCKRYKRSTKGYEFLGLVNEVKYFHKLVKVSEPEDYFPQENGTVTDQDGNEVFDPWYPELYDYGDYQYLLVSSIGFNQRTNYYEPLLKAVAENNPRLHKELTRTL